MSRRNGKPSMRGAYGRGAGGGRMKREEPRLGPPPKPRREPSPVVCRGCGARFEETRTGLERLFRHACMKRVRATLRRRL